MAEKRHILVVEDEEHLANGIRYNLDAEGYRVTTVGDGPAAIAVLEAADGHVDLVILDLMLPGMSGYAVCEWIRAKDRTLPRADPLCPHAGRGPHAGLRRRRNQYLTKPFDLDEFLSRVRNLLALHDTRSTRTARGPEPAVLEFADAKVNFETFEVTVGDQPVRMTQLEMSLLRYFAENEGRVIPRGELLENVWGLSGNVQTRATDQFVSRLRKTFESNPAQPKHFLTIRDAGYRFVMEPEESG